MRSDETEQRKRTKRPRDETPFAKVVQVSVFLSVPEARLPSHPGFHSTPQFPYDPSLVFMLV